MSIDQSILRCLRSSAVLALISWVAACGAELSDLTGPEPPPDVGIEPQAGCSDGVLAHGALFRICFPAQWNSNLVLYAHGYIAPDRPLALPDDQIEGQSVEALVTGLGYAFATTSYRANGLIAPEAVEDLVELTDTIERRYRPDPVRTAVVGFSEGGLVATLSAERHRERFDGALAGCGPIGSFRGQLDYIGDFRIVFDYFFPGVIPGSAVDIPEPVRSDWDRVYVPRIAAAIALNPDAARQLIDVTGAPVAGSDIRSLAETTVGLLWYNVFGTEDAQQRLGGQPLDNSARVYSGSSDDAALNAGVARFQADPATQAGVGRFETTGVLSVPVVTLHTTGDPIVPAEQAALYAEKVTEVGKTALLSQTLVDRFGHCSFSRVELLSAFSTLWAEIRSRPPVSLAAAPRLP